MEEKISMALIDESGNFIAVNKSDLKIESEIEIQIADSFTEINQNLNNKLKDDDERRIAEKFRLCQHLKSFMEEIDQ